MGTCTLAWANIWHPELHVEKEEAAKFHHEGSPSYTKKLTSLTWSIFVFLYPDTVSTVFPSIYITLKTLLYEEESNENLKN